MEFENNFPTINRPRKNPFRFVLLGILAVLFLGFLAYSGYKLLSSKDEEKKQVKTVITPTPTEVIFPTESNSADAESSPADAESSPASPSSINDSITPEITKTPTIVPTINSIDKASGLDRANLSIEVENGSGEVGAASKGSEFLKGLGYKVVATGNADNFNYENLSIEIKKEKSNYLSLLKKDLGLTYTVGSTSADLSSSSSSDAVVILGK